MITLPTATLLAGKANLYGTEAKIKWKFPVGLMTPRLLHRLLMKSSIPCILEIQFMYLEASIPSIFNNMCVPGSISRRRSRSSCSSQTPCSRTENKKIIGLMDIINIKNNKRKEQQQQMLTSLQSATNWSLSCLSKAVGRSF